MPRLRTFMSPVMFRYPVEGIDDAGVRLEQLDVNGNPLYWLDEMLEGGFEIPEDLWDKPDKSPSFILLLGGPPGTGKTTFALELCYNLARHEQCSTAKKMREISWTSLYVSLETPGNRIFENALSFGWQPAHFNLLPVIGQVGIPKLEWYQCNILGSEHFLVNANLPFNPANNFRPLIQRYLQSNPRNTLQRYPHIFDQLPNSYPPDVLVIDSLNLLWPQQPAPGPAPQVGPGLGQVPPMTLLEAFYQIIGDIGGGRMAMRPKILIVIVDGFTEKGSHNPWEYLADAAIRFDWAVGPENYHSRTFQINKIKTQTHVLGNNQVFKIVPRANTNQVNIANTKAPVADGTAAVSPRTRGIPYLPSGGTFVFPSIHWHLSQSIREDPVPGFARNINYPTGLKKLDKILQGATSNSRGFPCMHTTALTGRRGGMKSHLAYHFMLSHALGSKGIVTKDDKRPKNVLLISLRDDLDSARNTLGRLIEQQRIAGPNIKPDEVLEGLLKSDRLEILYNWPGCVSPNEFFHRIFVALARERKQTSLGSVFKECGLIPGSVDHNVCDATPKRKTAEIIVVNGLDHLDVKFPLCTAERVFVPALVSLFRCFKVCSVVISGDDRHGSLHDIRPLADLILDFSDYSPATCNVKIPANIAQTSKVSAVRVPAGQLGGQEGVLGRYNSGQMDFFR